jgi:hypothetical protein
MVLVTLPPGPVRVSVSLPAVRNSPPVPSKCTLTWRRVFTDERKNVFVAKVGFACGAIGGAGFGNGTMA